MVSDRSGLESVDTLCRTTGMLGIKLDEYPRMQRRAILGGICTFAFGVAMVVLLVVKEFL